jgi:hypothetical protein
VDEVTELERITDEEDRRIVAHKVPISFFGVELDCKAAHIAFGIGRAAAMPCAMTRNLAALSAVLYSCLVL